MERKWKKIGIATFGKAVFISDPSYSPDTWRTGETDKMIPGEYVCYAQFSDEKEWGIRVSAIKAVRKGYESRKAATAEYMDNIGVDTGQCGFYDRDYFLNVNRDRWGFDIWKEWYSKVRSAAYHKDGGFDAGIIDDRCFVSASGSGNGSYSCRLKKDEDGNVFELCLKYD